MACEENVCAPDLSIFFIIWYCRNTGFLIKLSYKTSN